jgi:hypothetical protein
MSVAGISQITITWNSSRNKIVHSINADLPTRLLFNEKNVQNYLFSFFWYFIYEFTNTKNLIFNAPKALSLYDVYNVIFSLFLNYDDVLQAKFATWVMSYGFHTQK